MGDDLTQAIHVDNQYESEAAVFLKHGPKTEQMASRMPGVTPPTIIDGEAK